MVGAGSPSLNVQRGTKIYSDIVYQCEMWLVHPSMTCEL